MNSIVSKVFLLSFLVITAACSDKTSNENKKEPARQEQQSDKGKQPLGQFKAVPMPDKSTYKSPKF